MNIPLEEQKAKAMPIDPNKKLSLKEKMIQLHERKKSVSFRDNKPRMSFMLQQKGIVTTPRINLFSSNNGI